MGETPQGCDGAGQGKLGLTVAELSLPPALQVFRVSLPRIFKLSNLTASQVSQNISGLALKLISPTPHSLSPLLSSDL